MDVNRTGIAAGIRRGGRTRGERDCNSPRSPSDDTGIDCVGSFAPSFRSEYPFAMRRDATDRDNPP